MISELFLYDRDKGLFKEILKKSDVIGGRYYVSPNSGHDLNTNNLDQYIKDPASGLTDVKQKYPCCVCITPKSSLITINGARWENFYFHLFFLCKTFTTGTNQIKSPDYDTNTSAHHVWYDWKDMKEVAVNFIEVLKFFIKNKSTTGTEDVPAVVLKTVVNVDFEKAAITRLSKFNNDSVSGVSISFIAQLYTGNCENITMPDIEVVSQKGENDSELTAADTVHGETPAGVIDGSNATFTTAFDFVPESVDVSDGVRLKVIEDYQTTGNRTIILNQSPLAGENILIDYIKL